MPYTTSHKCSVPRTPTLLSTRLAEIVHTCPELLARQLRQRLAQLGGVHKATPGSGARQRPARPPLRLVASERIGGEVIRLTYVPA